jgi:single-stranded-DNA-specific exonuclease
VGKGSARSVPGFALHEALAACSEHLVAQGGHAAAAGLTVEPERFPAFRDAFLEYAGEHLHESLRVPRLDIDAEATVEQISPGLAAAMDRLEPFGEGNRPPVFAFRRVRIVGRPRRMGERGEHVSFFAGRDGQALRCVAFRKAEALQPVLDSDEFVDVAFTPQRNRFRGRTDVEGLVHDVKLSEPVVEARTPSGRTASGADG